jgi:NAD+ synthase (glutamine-hydrolysing)
MKSFQVEDYYLPKNIQLLTGQIKVPFGHAIIRTRDTVIGVELCEELFSTKSPHVELALSGVEIFTNSSGSHHELRKLKKRLDLILGATQKCGGAYLYSNQKGCDGDRLYYDGCAMISLNGGLLAQGSQFSLNEVEVITASIDLDEIRSFRGGHSSSNWQRATMHSIPCVFVDTTLSRKNIGRNAPSECISPKIFSPPEEIAYGPACWLWDYLRRCKAQGFFLPLSGGLDSCSVALIVYSMCTLVMDAIKLRKDPQILQDLRRIVGEGSNSEWEPKSEKEICNRILHTCYLASEHSSSETSDRAKNFGSSIGSYHLNASIDSVVRAALAVFSLVTGKTPVFKLFGGSAQENLALQNIQARTRMIVSYLFAQLLCWVRGRNGNLLVLGSSNVDERCVFLTYLIIGMVN